MNPMKTIEKIERARLLALPSIALAAALGASACAEPQQRIELYSGSAIARKAPEGAVQWRPLAVGAGGQNLRMAFDPEDANRVYIAIDVAGIVKSEDGGKRWLNGNWGLHGLAEGSYPASDIAIAPGKKGQLFASWGRSFMKNGGILESKDFGESWSLLSKDAACDAEGKFARIDGGPGILIDPKTPSRMYCIDSLHDNGAGGVWISVDEGGSWSQSGLKKRQVRTIRFKPGDPSRIYASCIGNGDAKGGFLMSEDRGETWSERGLAGMDVRNFEFDAKNPNAIYAICGLDGFWRSEDGGATWSESNEGLPLKKKGASAKYFDYIYRAIAVDPFKAGHVVIGADPIRAFYESFDGGRSWRQMKPRGHVPQGWMLEPEHLGWHTNNIYFHPLVPGRMFLCDFFGTWRSDDGGANWSISPYGQESSCMVQILPDATIPKRLYLGIWDHFLLIYNDSQDKPQTLRCAGLYRLEGGANKHISGIAQFDKSPESMICVANSSIPFISSNRGLDWEKSAKGLPDRLDCRIGTPVIAQESALAFLPVNGDGVYKSSDMGKSWSRPANKGMKNLNLCSQWDPKQCVFAANDDASILAAATEGKLLLSEDQGETWMAPKIPVQASSLAIDGENSILLGGKEGGLWKSRDKGRNWTRLLENGGNVKLIAIDKGNPEKILCHTVMTHPDKTIDFGLKCSLDGGKSWQELFNSSMPTWNLQGIAFDPFDGKTVYANSHRCGAWAAELDAKP